MKKQLIAVLLACTMTMQGAAPALAGTNAGIIREVEAEGAAVDTENVGEAEGTAVDTENVGEAEGAAVGAEEIGETEDSSVRTDDLGEIADISANTVESFTEEKEDSAEILVEEEEAEASEAKENLIGKSDFDISEDGTVLLEYKGSAENVTIPEGIEEIDSCAFFSNSEIRKVTMPDSVKIIRSQAFRFCDKMTEIVLSRNLTTIEFNAFEACEALRTIELPDSITSLGNNAFKSCDSLEYIRLPEGITSIGKGSFSSDLMLRTVVIPDGVTSIGDNCFKNNRSDFTIVAREGSAAHEYAKKNNIPFVVKGQSVTLTSSKKAGAGTLQVMKDGKELAKEAKLEAGDTVYITASTAMTDLNVSANGDTLNYDRVWVDWSNPGKKELSGYPFVIKEDTSLEATFIDPFKSLDRSLNASGQKLTFVSSEAQSVAMYGRQLAKITTGGYVSTTVMLDSAGYVQFDKVTDGVHLDFTIDGETEEIQEALTETLTRKLSAGKHTLRWEPKGTFFHKTGALLLDNVKVVSSLDEVKATKFSLALNNMVLDIGETVKPAYTIEPALLQGKRSVSWTSSDTSVVSVKNNALKGLKRGMATVTADVDGIKQILTVYVSGKKYVTQEEIEKETVHASGAYITGETSLADMSDLFGRIIDAAKDGHEIRVRWDDSTYLFKDASLYRLNVARESCVPETLLTLSEDIEMACVRGSVIYLLTEEGAENVRITGFDTEKNQKVYEQVFPIALEEIGSAFAADDEQYFYFIRNEAEICSFNSKGEVVSVSQRIGGPLSSGLYGMELDQVDPFGRSLLVTYDGLGRSVSDFEEYTYNGMGVFDYSYSRSEYAGICLIRNGELPSSKNYVKNMDAAVNGGKWVFLNLRNYAVNANGQIVRFYKTHDNDAGINYEILYTVPESSEVPKAVSAGSMVYVLTDKGTVYQFDTAQGKLVKKYKANNAQLRNLYVSGDTVYARYTKDNELYVAPLSKLSATAVEKVVRKDHVTLGYSKESVKSAYQKSLATLDYWDTSKVYATKPSTKAPYAAGKLSTKAVNETLGRLNYARWQCGLNQVTVNQKYMERSQKGAVVLAATNELTHYPTQPKDMDDAFFKEASAGVGAGIDYSGNCSYGDSIYDSIKGYLDDTNNVMGGIGHRLSLLDKNADKVSFGAAGIYSCLSMYYASAALNNKESYYAWPSAGYFPTEMIDPSAAWHIQTSGKQKDELKISLKYNGKTYAAEEISPDAYYNAYAFKLPENLRSLIAKNGAFKDGTEVTVTMTGLEDEEGSPITVTYPVKFFSAAEKHAAKVTLNTNAAKVLVGRTLQLKATVSPKNAVEGTVTWKSDNAKIAKVSKKGVVTAVAPGTVTIRATTANGVKATCKITVGFRYVYECSKNGVYRYTTSTKTVKQLQSNGWSYKKAFRAPGLSSEKVYYICNKTTKRYRYSANKAYAEKMKAAGHKVGTAFYQASKKTVPVYELVKGSKKSYFYTTSAATRTKMKQNGWKEIGIAWYAQPK